MKDFVFEKNNLIDDNFLRFNNLSFKDIKSKNYFAIAIDFKNIDKQKQSLKGSILKVFRLYKKSIKKNIQIGYKDVVFKIYNYDDTKENKEIIDSLKACMIINTKDRYTFIYDTACDVLDHYFYVENYCDFHNNKCGEKINTKSNVGCCRHYKHKFLGPITGALVPCEYLKNGRCITKCLPCKLFTCDYLAKKGISFKASDFLALYTFLNPFQRLSLRTMVYTEEDKIIKRLLRQRYSII